MAISDRTGKRLSKRFGNFEALDDLTQPVEDFVDEAREDVKEKLKEFDENMSEHEWYRKNRIAIFIAAAFALFFALAVTQVIIEHS